MPKPLLSVLARHLLISPNLMQTLEKFRSEQRRVFVADDDAAMRHMLASSLRSRGFTVLECANGVELLDRLLLEDSQDNPPLLVVSDVHMPGVSGLDVAHRLKEALPKVPVILITAFGDRRTHQRARSLGAFRVINKPFALDELHREVSAALGEVDCAEHVAG